MFVALVCSSPASHASLGCTNLQLPLLSSPTISAGIHALLPGLLFNMAREDKMFLIVFYFVPSTTTTTFFLFSLGWKETLCVHWVFKAHPAQSFVHTCLPHCLLMLRETPLVATWFQGALLEADQWRLNSLQSSTTYHKPCLNEYLVFKHRGLHGGLRNFKNIEKDMEALILILISQNKHSHLAHWLPVIFFPIHVNTFLNYATNMYADCIYPFQKYLEHFC